jgi:hypothetical protein
MGIEAARTNLDGDLVAQLVGAGERLAESVGERILRRGREVVPALVEILNDEGLARDDAPGGGHAPIHAATLLGELEAGEAIEPMLRVLARCDPMDVLYSALIHALRSLGARVLEPALAAHASAESEDQRGAIANVLSGLGAHDDRILSILLRMLGADVELGAGLLAEYGDPAALPQLGAALDGCELDARGGFLVNHEVIELEAAIEELGGALTEEQKGKVRAVKAAREEARAPLLAIGGSEDDDEDDVDDGECEREREEVIGRFSESPLAGSAPGLSWIDLSLRYGAEFESVSFSEFNARVLHEVLFELFPRKVSCESSAAPEIVRSLRAFWTFARDVLSHAQAEACLEELGDDAIPRLARRLEDPSNFGMAKSFVMMGYNAEKPAQSALRALPGRTSDASKRKKKLRKQRKKAQRRNRR